MSKKTWITIAVGAMGALLVGGMAWASEALAPGDYQFSLPGVGAVTVSVALETGDVTVAAVPEGWTAGDPALAVVQDDSDDDGEMFVMDLNDPALQLLKLEISGDEIEGKLYVAADGEYTVTLPDGMGTAIVTIEDGAIVDTIAPDGWTVEPYTDDEDGETKAKIVSPDGAIEVTFEMNDDGQLEFKVQADSDDDESLDADDDDQASVSDDQGDDEEHSSTSSSEDDKNDKDGKSDKGGHDDDGDAGAGSDS